MTIYLPDELGERVKAADLNVSGVCQHALVGELDRLDAIKRLDESEEMARVELYDHARDQRVAFMGQHLVTTDRADYAAYRTEHGRIAVEDMNRERLYVYEDFDELAADFGDAELVAEVAGVLGEDYTIMLDI
jgi:post-segregation antitoxin (ccd killing protein)